MSFTHLFMQSTPLVKGVMLLLVLFSVWSWAVAFIKWFDFKKSKAALDGLEDALESGDVDGLISHSQASTHPIADVFKAGVAEWKDGSGEHEHEGLHEVRDRIATAMRLEASNEARRMQFMLPFLASVGSSSPFIGLFGTVWGIMNTFTQIGAMKDTSLSTVAPGIAEALFATGIGLAAAIPAILAYNKFTTDLSRYNGRLATAIGVFSGKLSKRKPA
ncbi:flagellar motor protein MotA [Stagnimonas aquatica]|uniref:Flagellar motor protein MotA n=2 Tax=Stagnimonas aquatica TaxID=2689987 RepID=A0A3N0VH95_9GAMM|nr:flagellar motor protein MotA [Stagnimonas aquatica]